MIVVPCDISIDNMSHSQTSHTQASVCGYYITILLDKPCSSASQLLPLIYKSVISMIQLNFEMTSFQVTTPNQLNIYLADGINGTDHTALPTVPTLPMVWPLKTNHQPFATESSSEPLIIVHSPSCCLQLRAVCHVYALFEYTTAQPAYCNTALSMTIIRPSSPLATKGSSSHLMNSNMSSSCYRRQVRAVHLVYTQPSLMPTEWPVYCYNAVCHNTANSPSCYRRQLRAISSGHS